MNVTWLWNKCRRQEERLSLLAASLLPEEERPKADAHLARCPSCQARLAVLRRLASQLDQAGRQLPPVQPAAALRARWQQAVLGEPAAAGRRQPCVEPVGAGWLESWFTGGRWAWGTVGLCWLLIALCQVASPQAPKPVVATAPVSWSDVLLVWERTRPQGEPDSRAGERSHDAAPQRPPPRSQRATPTVQT